MAPFIPQGLINPELNLFFALIIGFGFGYVLEQAGFSSSKKLAGVFYGYDFVVLRVFFTAGITAMVGLVFMEYFGWIDMSLVYINPTFLWSAIIGGVIMGFGFIMGGFCPGTSIVGAVTGKIDAMLFVVGVFVGIFIFGHFYNAFEPIYNGYFLGHPFIYETIGISNKWFVFLMALMALAAFVFTKIIEDKINKVSIKQLNERPNYSLPAFLLVALITIFLFLPQERRSGINERSREKVLSMYQSKEFYSDAIEIAYKIINEDHDIILIDVRDSLSASHFMLPGAVHIQLESILDKNRRQLLKNKDIKKVFYSNGESRAVMAWLLCTRAGYDNIFVLKGGLNEFFNVFFDETEKDSEFNDDMMNEFRSRFIAEARQFFIEKREHDIIKPLPKPVKTIIEISVPENRGGC